MLLLACSLGRTLSAAEDEVPRWLALAAKSALPPTELLIEYEESEPGGRVNVFRLDGRGRGVRMIRGERSSLRRYRVNPRDVHALLRVIALEHRFLKRPPLAPPLPDETLPARLSLKLAAHEAHYSGRAKPGAGPKSAGLSLIRFRLRLLLPDSSH